MSEEVKDLLERAAGWYEPTPVDPDDLPVTSSRRPRRLQAAILASVLCAGAGALVWTAFRPTSPAKIGDAGAGSELSVALHGVAARYPSSWTLVDLWPLASELATWPDPVGTSIEVRAGTPERGGLPVLQLSNQDLGLASLCGTDLTGGEAVLYVAANGGPYLVDGSGLPRWTGTLTRDEGPCGPGLYAYRHSTDGGGGAGEERPYMVFAGFGPQASSADRAAVFAAFASLSFDPAGDFLRPPADATPSYVTGTRLPSASPTARGLPTVSLTPDRGPVGTVVTVQGYGFTDPFWREVASNEADGYGVFLIGRGPGGCELIARGAYTLDISPDGHLLAALTVPSRGSCFQEGRTPEVLPGTYSVGIGCHACEVGTFEVVDAPLEVPARQAPQGSVWKACPGTDGTLPVSDADAAGASSAVETFLSDPKADALIDAAGLANGLRPGMGAPSEAVVSAVVVDGAYKEMIARVCGEGVADRSVGVTVDDGTDSASLDFTLFLVHRDTGWKVWAEY